MTVLIIGGGGREHTIAWKLAQSPKVDKMWCLPGNGGIAQVAECVPIKATDLDGIAEFAAKVKPDLTVVAPDDPLVLGLVDRLQSMGLRAFGPNKAAAIIEGSKCFSKDLMKRYAIPTAAYETFDNASKAIAYINTMGAPIVVKADGLALGKGVTVAMTEEEAVNAVKSIMEDKAFGASGDRIVIEEFMKGPEVSVLCFTDGITVVPMVSAQDHKRAYDGDKGPNTGGMGTFSPSRHYTGDIADVCMKTIFRPTIDAMSAEGRPFKGVLYFGLMLTDKGPKVLEYNCRFGDPETQVVLPRLKSDLYDIMNAVIDGTLSQADVSFDDNAAACVVLASGGYPLKYQTGYEITGLKEAEKAGGIVFHAGTALKDGATVTAGGRVLGVTGVSNTLSEAIEKAYRAAQKISFQEMHFRRDIGVK